jgi:hypothetical protein
VCPGVAERMRVQVRDAGVRAAAPEHRLDPISIKGRAASGCPARAATCPRTSAGAARASSDPAPEPPSLRGDRPVPGPLRRLALPATKTMRSRRSTSATRMCRRSSSVGPTSGWCSAIQSARLRTAFW